MKIEEYLSKPIGYTNEVQTVLILEMNLSDNTNSHYLMTLEQ